jgi:membrane associated rhomboid family serine protease
VRDLLNRDNEQEIMRNWAFSLMGPLTRWGYFSSDLALMHGQVWRFVTFQFLHGSVMHLAANMLGLFFFGQIVEAQFGPRRYAAFYLLCGLAGAMCYLLLGLAHVLPDGPRTPLVGASAGVFGLLVAAAVIAPHLELFVWLIPVTVKMLAVGGLLLAAYQVFAAGENAGGEAAHLGGGLLGLVLMKNQHWLNPFGPSRQAYEYAGSARRRRRSRTFQKDWSKDPNR